MNLHVQVFDLKKALALQQREWDLSVRKAATIAKSAAAALVAANNALSAAEAAEQTRRVDSIAADDASLLAAALLPQASSSAAGTAPSTAMSGHGLHTPTLAAQAESLTIAQLKHAVAVAAAAAAEADAAVEALANNSGPLRQRRYKRSEPFVDFDLTGVDVRIRGNVKLQLVRVCVRYYVLLYSTWMCVDS